MITVPAGVRIHLASGHVHLAVDAADSGWCDVDHAEPGADVDVAGRIGVADACPAATAHDRWLIAPFMLVLLVVAGLCLSREDSAGQPPD